MAPLRLRHPKGVSTIQVDFDNDTVQDLQHKIFSVSEIMPSQQELKAGYPPITLAIIPELPMASLGLKQGEQIMVTQRRGSGAPIAPSAAPRAPVAPPPRRAFSPPPQQSSRAQQSLSAAVDPASPDFVEIDAGVLVHRIVPDDNSCLFSSVALVFEQDISKAPRIRQKVADAIRAHPDTWNEAILGQPRESYISTILKPTSWGGAIELSILATHYRAEIASIDVETGRIDHFAPSASVGPPSNRCILIYSGIHYDAASLAPTPDSPPDFHQTLFPLDGFDTVASDDADPVMIAAKSLAGKLRARRAYTNTATFDLKCNICGKGLKGEKEARSHASETGHTEFGEY